MAGKVLSRSWRISFRTRIFQYPWLYFYYIKLFMFSTSTLEPERVIGNNINVVSQYLDMLTHFQWNIPGPSLTQRYKDVSFGAFLWEEAKRSLR